MEPPENSPTPPKGMPIYSDTQVRLIVDSLEETANSEDWYPANAMAIKLWQCIEALRDIDIALENVGHSEECDQKEATAEAVFCSTSLASYIRRSPMRSDRWKRRCSTLA